MMEILVRKICVKAASASIPKSKTEARAQKMETSAPKISVLMVNVHTSLTRFRAMMEIHAR
jgi:hypothetical protein